MVVERDEQQILRGGAEPGCRLSLPPLRESLCAFTRDGQHVVLQLHLLQRCLGQHTAHPAQGTRVADAGEQLISDDDQPQPACRCRVLHTAHRSRCGNARPSRESSSAACRLAWPTEVAADSERPIRPTSWLSSGTKFSPKKGHGPWFCGSRSEERRVGKEWRARGAAERRKRKRET